MNKTIILSAAHNRSQSGTTSGWTGSESVEIYTIPGENPVGWGAPPALFISATINGVSVVLGPFQVEIYNQIVSQLSKSPGPA